MNWQINQRTDKNSPIIEQIPHRPGDFDAL